MVWLVLRYKQKKNKQFGQYQKKIEFCQCQNTSKREINGLVSKQKINKWFGQYQNISKGKIYELVSVKI